MPHELEIAEKMINSKETRWKQRMENFTKAYNKLREAVSIYTQLNDIEKEGMVQRFEYTFELAWKTLKDYLESKGEIEKFPRDVIKKAFETQLIADGGLWLEMLDNRNIMAHTYDETNFNTIIDKIAGSYFTSIEQLINLLKSEL